ncbi:hypothetical protein C8Q80DRAFT_510509 [Daedaleopsis nitida]|nr:hypothetical protein C8Q80DRAFT_510509 [Daedaleopsis nitida]
MTVSAGLAAIRGPRMSTRGRCAGTVHARTHAPAVFRSSERKGTAVRRLQKLHWSTNDCTLQKRALLSFGRIKGTFSSPVTQARCTTMHSQELYPPHHNVVNAFLRTARNLELDNKYARANGGAPNAGFCASLAG